MKYAIQNVTDKAVANISFLDYVKGVGWCDDFNRRGAKEFNSFSSVITAVREIKRTRAFQQAEIKVIPIN